MRVTMAVFTLVAMSCAVANANFAVRHKWTNLSETELRDGLMSSTNHWMSSVSHFRTAIMTNANDLAYISTDSSRCALRCWGEEMLKLNVLTNDYDVWSRWAPQKAWALNWYLGLGTDPLATNVWMGVAEIYGAAKGGTVSREAYKARREAVARRIRANGGFKDMAVCDSFRTEMNEYFNRGCVYDGIRTSLRHGLVDLVGVMSLRKLPVESRWAFYSNFVERANFDADEVDKIRRALEREDAAQW